MVIADRDCRPCESRDPYAAASLAGAGARRLSNNSHRWLWVPAFAGTTVERLAFAGRRLAPLRLARRRTEQRLLQILEAFGKPRPVAGECILRASRILRMRPDVVHGCRWLAVRHHPSPCRYPFILLRLFILQRGLLQQLLLLFRRQRRRDAIAPLAVEEGGILFVDVLLFRRRRVRAGNIEAAVLHEIVIGIAAARLAPSGEFGIARGERRGLGFLGRRLLRGVGAFLEIGRRVRPPLRRRARGQQRGAGSERGNQQGGWARRDQGRFPNSSILQEFHFTRVPLTKSSTQRNLRQLSPLSARFSPPKNLVFPTSAVGFCSPVTTGTQWN